MRVDCRAHARRISPLIYGIGLDPRSKPDALSLGATARRWGGNTTSRFNWLLDRAWNTGSDWFFENVEGKSFSRFADENASHGLGTALTVPMIGWVAKDTRSASFPVSLFGRQERTDEGGRDAGNGRRPDGSLLPPGAPTDTSVAATPEFVGRWVDALRRASEATGRAMVDPIILDNEPSLWSSTHRDVHPEPVGYDELLERSVAYASAIRRADPRARIAGPAEWGWTGYFYSARDTRSGVTLRPDRRAHGDRALVPWYLGQLKAESERHGTRLLDLLDLHFYPQADRVYSSADDPATAALRIRQTRALWDRAYVDESWIKEPIFLLPRMHEWADAWPGTGIMIGEWSFGGEGHMSGALAIAEALGRFAEYGVDAAFYWTVPPAGSPAAMAFRAYRGESRAGHGGPTAPFGAYFLPSTTTKGTSLFASRDEGGTRVVLVALNFSPSAAAPATVDLASCGSLGRVSGSSYSSDLRGFETIPTAVSNGTVTATLPAYSISVFEVELRSALAAVGD